MATLQIVLTVHEGTVDDDDVFGTKARKRVGDAWPINSAAALTDFNREDSPLQLKTLEGQTRLVGVRTLNGRKCLELTGSLKSSDVVFPSKPGVTYKEGTLESSMRGLFPIGQRCASESVSMKAMTKMEIETPDGTVTNQMIFQESAETEFGD